MSTLTAFFKHSDTQFGVFYPQNYLVAIFADMTKAEHAMLMLRNSGFTDEDVIAVPGTDVIQFAEELRMNDSVWGLLMQQLSRAFATEEKYMDHDLKLAAAGAAFVCVYCPTEKLKQDAWKTIQPAEPLIARHYTVGGIEHLKGEV
jgi:hypothetical protein